jgi:hypothetical protein
MRKQLRGPRGRYIGREERIKVLELLKENGGDQKAACEAFDMTPREVGRIVANDRFLRPGGPKQQIVELVIKERTLREELYRGALEAVKAPLGDPVALMKEFLETSGIPAPDDFLATYLKFLTDRAKIGTRILEGVENGLTKQSETKHTVDVNIQQVILNNLKAGRERIARLSGEVSSGN